MIEIKKAVPFLEEILDLMKDNSFINGGISIENQDKLLGLLKHNNIETDYDKVHLGDILIALGFNNREIINTELKIFPYAKFIYESTDLLALGDHYEAFVNDFANNRLDGKHRDIFTDYLSGMSYSDIAKKYHCHLGSAREYIKQISRTFRLYYKSLIAQSLALEASGASVGDEAIENARKLLVGEYVITDGQQLSEEELSHLPTEKTRIPLVELLVFSESSSKFYDNIQINKVIYRLIKSEYANWTVEQIEDDDNFAEKLMSIRNFGKVSLDMVRKILLEECGVKI